MSNHPFLEAVKESSEEGQKHLTSAQFAAYLFDQGKLDAMALHEIKAHVSDCDRCEAQVKEVTSNPDFYRSLPKIDQ